ncbi:STAS domain-containing protein [Actinoplanes sp. NPDC049681]|uniref:STAS domain-containing protein n=1 Tax=Actinoplanes sp. NPDC049681 TaxID=3363905 RepID=UPI0037B9E682
MTPIWQHVEYRSGGTCTMSLRGELDLSCVNELTSLVLAEADPAGTSAIHVDLSGVHFIDSSAIGALITGYKAAAATNTAFSVTGAHGQVRRVLVIAGVSWLADGGTAPM